MDQQRIDVTHKEGSRKRWTVLITKDLKDPAAPEKGERLEKMFLQTPSVGNLSGDNERCKRRRGSASQPEKDQPSLTVGVSKYDAGVLPSQLQRHSL